MAKDHRHKDDKQTVYLPELQQLLLHCLRVEWTSSHIHILSQLPDEQWKELILLTEQQKVAPLLYYRCRRYQTELALSPHATAMLQARYYYSARWNQMLWKELGAILNKCHQQEIDVLVLKGAVLFCTVYPNKALRQMADLDLLVPEAALRAVVDLLLARGYEAKSQIGTEILDHFTILHHLPSFVHPESNICVELHGTIAPPNRSYSIDIAELWAAAQPLPIAGDSAFTLSPEDLLLYTCMHATYRHLFEFGARFLCDVDAIVRHYQDSLDWDHLVVQAQARQWQNGVFLGLYLAQRLLEAPIPPSTLEALQPAEFHEQIMEESLRLIFDDHQATADVDGEFAQKWIESSLLAKLGKGLQMVLLSRRKMATRYPAAPNSLKIFLYYPVRVKDLLMSNAPRVRQMQCTDPAVADVIRRKSRLLNWLEKQTIS